MNERIKQLLGQAYDEAVPETWTTLSSEQLGRIYEKFAELIVKDCMAISKTWEDQLEKAKLPSEADAVGIVTYRISRQFGVEE